MLQAVLLRELSVTNTKMNRILTIPIGDTKKWDQIVTSFTQHDVYYLSGYVKAFQVHGDGTPYLFFYESDSLRCINVAMKQDIASITQFNGVLPPATYFDLMTPYGYGGFLFEGDINNETLSEFKDAYSQYMQVNNIVSEFVRYHPILKNATIASKIFPIINKGETAYMDLATPELIWDNMKPNSRNNIRKAKKSAITIQHSCDPALYKDFRMMYNEVMQRNEASPYYYFKDEFFASIQQDLQNNHEFFYASYGDKIIAMSLLIYANRQLHSHLSCSDAAYRQFAPSNLLLYEAACWGHENGMKTMHLGGGVGYKNDDLLRFKQTFNKNSSLTASIGTNVYIQEVYDLLVGEQKDNNTSPQQEKNTFFPLFRYNQH